ncbi:hypothetical protein E5288_WYG020037 [Bos mutus]|uniref:Uncharacterized protein n=1 Tax=Bos mutus TaxID=72004 RepID=A0A6B0RM28_9CETA|nr:hypothetical protein [Bos mutus]
MNGHRTTVILAHSTGACFGPKFRTSEFRGHPGGRSPYICEQQPPSSVDTRPCTGRSPHICEQQPPSSVDTRPCTGHSPYICEQQLRSSVDTRLGRFRAHFITAA